MSLSIIYGFFKYNAAFYLGFDSRSFSLPYNYAVQNRQKYICFNRGSECENSLFIFSSSFLITPLLT